MREGKKCFNALGELNISEITAAKEELEIIIENTILAPKPS